MTTKNKSIRLPVASIAAELKYLHGFYAPATEDNGGVLDVRLQVFPNGQWALHYGAPDYDTDHHGAWAAGTIDLGERMTARHARIMARTLINQAADMADGEDFDGVDVYYAKGNC